MYEGYQKKTLGEVFVWRLARRKLLGNHLRSCLSKGIPLKIEKNGKNKLQSHSEKVYTDQDETN